MSSGDGVAAAVEGWRVTARLRPILKAGASRVARWAAAGWSAWGQERAGSAYGRETSNACLWPK
jgi:hypothetical protein